MKESIAEKYYIPPGLTNESVIIDGGAYRGQWTRYMFNTYYCQIFAVEPYCDNALFLKSLFYRSPSKVKVIEAALWDSDGIMELFLGNPLHKNNGCSMYNRFQEYRTVDVNTITINTLMKLYKIDKVDLLKLNVEGSEVDILTNLDKTIANKISCICFAPHDGKIVTEKAHNEMLEHLRYIGYEIQDYTSEGWGSGFRRVVCIKQ